MHEVEKNTGKATKSRIGYLFGIIMLLIYLTGLPISLYPLFRSDINPTLRYIFAGVFAAYAIFRGYRFIKG